MKRMAWIFTIALVVAHSPRALLAGQRINPETQSSK